MTDLLALIAARRSVGVISPEPIPRDAVERILRVAVTAPNHHGTRPWRFVVLSGPARRHLGEVHANSAAICALGLDAVRREKEAARLERAPVVVACGVRASSPDPIRRREDRDAVAAAIQNMLLAAHGSGLATIWRTGDMVDEPEVVGELGFDPDDQVVGFVYLGAAATRPVPRDSVGDLLADCVEWRWLDG